MMGVSSDCLVVNYYSNVAEPGVDIEGERGSQRAAMG